MSPSRSAPRELMARVEALLRRSRPALAGESLPLAISSSIPSLAPRAPRGGESLHLGPTEFRLLRHFHGTARPRLLAPADLLDAVWGMDSDIDERTVDVHIRRLRKAINLPGRTVRSAG
jgi:two-component system phosphate regulon response regulator PhoB